MNCSRLCNILYIRLPLIRIFGVIGFGPLDENEAMKGINPSFISSLLNIMAVTFLVIGRVIDEKRLNSINLKCS